MSGVVREEQEASVSKFAALVFAFVCWIVLVIVFFPRFLGRLLAFLANRAARGSFYVVIPTLHLYPLAGRIVAHSVGYTNQDFTASVEELVLQCRWWRKHGNVELNQILTVDAPETFDPVVLAQQKIDRENSARFLKRCWYRLRRWWQRTAVTKDANDPKEPAPLVSLILVGLRLRLVNNTRNYAHVQKVMSRFISERSGAQVTLSDSMGLDRPTAHNIASLADRGVSTSSSSTFSSVSRSSVESVDEKPFSQRLLELSSLRISDGAVYFCDMGQTPLVRITVDSAKMRYRYGAPACTADICRKRIRVGISSLKLSVASLDAVHAIVKPESISTGETSSQSSSDQFPSLLGQMEDNTERMVQHVMSNGYRGISDPFWEADSSGNVVDDSQQMQRLRRANILRKLSSLQVKKNKLFLHEIRKTHSLSCVDIIRSNAAVVEYVFDEPGLIPEPIGSNMSSNPSERAPHGPQLPQQLQEESAALPPPVCRVSVLLHGADGTYDVGAFTNVERVQSRFQPMLYDYYPLSKPLQAREGRRMAVGMSIEVEATPKSEDSNKENDARTLSLLRVPFTPQESTWGSLIASRIRKLRKTSSSASGNSISSNEDVPLPNSNLELKCSRLSVRYEVPFCIGVHQKMTVTIKDAQVSSEGIVDIPFLKSPNAVITRTVHHPEVWNEEHVVSTDVQLIESELLYVPDFMRIIGDVSTSMQKQSQRPPAVNYFVPYKETTKIRAEENYCITLSCGRDNAWEDVSAGIGDEHGKLKISGEKGELLLSPNAATEFLADASSMSWSLVLSDVSANLELLLPAISKVGNNEITKETQSRFLDLSRTGQYRVRPPSLSRRARSYTDTNDQSSLNRLSGKVPEYQNVDIQIFRLNGACELRGKVLSHVDRRYKGTQSPAFLDAVNISDTAFRAEALQMDLNPFHVSHILNIVRNYCGIGTHSISIVERASLDKHRNTVANNILSENRFPNWQECLILGLASGQTLPPAFPRAGIDDLTKFSFHISSVLLRLHELPHPTSPIDLTSRNICSIVFDQFKGDFSSNRLGSNLVLFPCAQGNISIFGGCLYSCDKLNGFQDQPGTGRITPMATIQNVEIHKRGLASQKWSIYYSSLSISIGEISGCLLDMTVASLSKMGVAFVPDGGSQAVTTINALLSVDNIELSVDRFDVLVLSSSSAASAEKASQISTIFPWSHENRRQQQGGNLIVPKFLAGVTHVRLVRGFRILSSSLAFELDGFVTRILLPSVIVNTLVPSGGKLTPWIDEATVRAQVAHATLPRRESSHEMNTDFGIMRRAAEMQELDVDIAFTSKPSTWAQYIPASQRAHVAEEHRITRGGVFPWCSRRALRLKEVHMKLKRTEIEVNAAWWEFLSGSKVGKIINRHRDEKNSTYRVDSLSICLLSEAVVVISPECMEVVVEILVRASEAENRRNLLVPRSSSANSVQLNPVVLSHDLLALWKEFEKHTLPFWMTQREKITPGFSFKALETQEVTILLLPPALFGDTTERNLRVFPKTLGDEMFISLPHGFNLFNETRFEISYPLNVEQNNPGRPLPNVVRTSSLHSNFTMMDIGCNNMSLVHIQKVVLINHERNSVTVSKQSPSDDAYLRRDRKTSVGKVDVLKIGCSSASLGTYETCGRIGAIFLFMLRPVHQQMLLLTERIEARRAWLCETVLLSTMQEVILKDADMARSFFVAALNSIVTCPNEQSAVEGVSLVDMSLPNISDVRKRAEIPTHSSVHSFDLTLRDMAVMIEDQRIIESDVFSCKGGKTASPGTYQSELEGYVLNASFGTVSLSVRDDIAASALRTLANVARYVQKASFSFPLLHCSGRYEDVNTNIKTPSFVSGKSRPNSVPVPERKVAFRNSFSVGQFPLANYRRTSNASRYSRNNRSTSLFFQNANQGASPGSILSTMENNQVGPFSSVYHGFQKTYTPMPVACGKESLVTSSNQSLAKITQNKIGNVQNDSNVLSSPETKTGDDVRIEDGFKIITVRTAGDSGPDRKRSRRMVPIAPIIPLAFSVMNDNATKPESQEISGPLSNSKVPPTQGSRVRKAGRVSIVESKSLDSTPISPSLSLNSHLKGKSSSIPTSKKPNVTLFVSFQEVVSHYYREEEVVSSNNKDADSIGNITFLVHAPRLTLMSHTEAHQYSAVLTASSSKLFSSNNPHCILTGSIAQVGGTVSLAKALHVSSLPKLLISFRVSEFKATLQATDLKSVLKLRNEFKMDLRRVNSAFLLTKQSLSETAKTMRLFSSRGASPTSFSTMALDAIFERSEIKLEGFHPNDVHMSMSYVLDGFFFSVVASEDDNAALSLGLRLHGHGLMLSSPSWPSNEYFRLPSIDARGVQWSESIGLPTVLKVISDPLVNFTSFQGLRHVLFTISGLLAFQHKGVDANEAFDSQVSLPRMSSTRSAAIDIRSYNIHGNTNSNTGASPFTRSFAAWERTKGVRMDISICPISMSLASGQVVALFNLDTVTGVIEWNKLVVSGVQLQTAVSVPKVSLSFMRMPTADFSAADIRPDDKRASLSIFLERSRIDLLKSQENLTHSFIFQTNVLAVSGQIRPWRLLLDASVWADEQEFVSDLQSINYNALSTSRRLHRSISTSEAPSLTEHRLILFGANIQRVLLAVPLVNSEQYSTSRLAIRATDLHLLARHRFDSQMKPSRNIFNIKSHFIGILWENSSLLSSHHSHITVGVTKSLKSNRAHFGILSIVLAPGTWRICPRRDVVMAILDAKNRKDNKFSDRVPFFGGGPTDSLTGSIDAGESMSNATEKESRLLVDNLSLKILRTSGFIEGLENEGEIQQLVELSSPKGRKETAAKVSVPAFSISAVRCPGEDFDLIDVDLSGREGEFPKGCIQRVVNLFSDLFGAVASDQLKHTQQESSTNVPLNSRDISRNISILIRFGRSFYRAQEEASLSLESKVALFAGKNSALLISVITGSVINIGCSHTTVITGVSPSLALEITPLLDGAQMQSLRLRDVRFQHGLCPCHAPQSLVHINRITAMMEAKTLLLTRNRLRNRGLAPQGSRVDLSKMSVQALTAGLAERNLMFILGKPRTKQICNESNSDGKNRTEADIRMQLKLLTKANEAEGNQANLAIERLHVGVNRFRLVSQKGKIGQNIHSAVHDVILQGRWDILTCKLRLLENLTCFDTARHVGNPTSPLGHTGFANIINRLHVENLQYGKPTLKLDADALATMWAVPSRNVAIESTKVRAEVSHTLRKAIAKFASQWKKLHNEVKLLSERDSDRKGKVIGPRHPFTQEESGDVLLPKSSTQLANDDIEEITDKKSVNSMSSGVEAPLLQTEGLTDSNERTEVTIKGDKLVVMMRGYQFDETRHSAMISLYEYDVQHFLDYKPKANDCRMRQLSTNFREMVISYHDDERRIRSDLFKIPSPKLKLSIVDLGHGLNIGLVGNLEVRLGHGFYNWQEFRELIELTIRGIAPAPPRDGVEQHPGQSAVQALTVPNDEAELWHGKKALAINVQLNPRIDVIGDLTADVLPMMSARLKRQVDGIPRLMYDYMMIPIEGLSKALCKALP